MTSTGSEPRRRVDLDGGIYATVGYEGGHPDRLALYWEGGEFIAAANLSNRARSELAVALLDLPEPREVGSGHDEQTEGLLAVANQAGVSIHNANGPVLRMTLDEAVKLRDDFERALAVHGLGTVAAVVEEVDRWYHGKPPIQKPLLEYLAERFGSSVSGGE